MFSKALNCKIQLKCDIHNRDIKINSAGLEIPIFPFKSYVWLNTGVCPVDDGCTSENYVFIMVEDK